MSRTGLAFHRKNQSLEDLASERPKSIAAVRQALQEAIEHVDSDISSLEREFYGGRTCDDDIRAILPHTRAVMSSFDVTYIHGAFQFKEINVRYNDKTENIRVDEVSMQKFMDYNRKIVSFVPHKFNTVIKETEEIMNYVEKYLLSYFQGSKDKYLETPTHYEMKRRELREAIRTHLSNIPCMARMYCTKGLSVSVFGLAVNELARRCDCGDLPFLLMFPQCCQNMKNICQGLSRWIANDAEYAGFLACDIVDMESRKQKQQSKTREAQDLYFTTYHKLKQTKREIKELLDDLNKLQRREKDNIREVRRLEEDIKMMHIDIEMKEDERQRIHQMISDNPELDCSKELEKIAANISDLRYKIPAATKEIQHVKSKISFISDKRSILKIKQESLVNLKKEAAYRKMEARLQVSESKRVDDCLETLKYIHLQKTSPASTKNIFHQMPARVKLEPVRLRVPEAKNNNRPQKASISKSSIESKEKHRKKDELEKASDIVAKKIDSDWSKLYRNLPFYPSRGEKNLDNDVIDITTERLRSGNKVKAKDSLEKWRRMHTRANLNELKNTLQKVNRQDVVQEIDQHLRPCTRQPKSKVMKRWNKLRAYNMITARLRMPKIKTVTAALKGSKTNKIHFDATSSKNIGLPSIFVTKTD